MEVNAAPSVRSALLTGAAARVDGSQGSFCVVDLDELARQDARWRAALPRVTPHYAVKANPDPLVLRTLSALGVRFDCASGAEIRAALEAGATTDEILYANPCKSLRDISIARECGVLHTVVDSVEEVIKLAATHPEARCLVRVLVDDSAARCRLGDKFGASLTEVADIVDAAAAHGIALTGVSYHVGSGSSDKDAYVAAIRVARAAFDLLSAGAARYGVDAPTTLDIGGGFPGGDGFEGIAVKVRTEIDKLFPDDGSVNVIAEPGRFYVASSHTLAVAVIGRRLTYDGGVGDGAPGSGAHQRVFLSDGLYGTFNCLMYDHASAHPRVLMQAPAPPMARALSSAPAGAAAADAAASFSTDAGSAITTSLWGPTCDGLDRVLERTKALPPLRAGDWLAFESWGAYTVAAASTFNGIPLPERVYIGGEGITDRRARATGAAGGAAGGVVVEEEVL